MVAIIAILTSLLVPALTQTRNRAVANRCLNNLRQIGVASAIYFEENDGAIPQSSQARGWLNVLDPKLDGTNMFRCTLDRGSTNRAISYGMNDFLTPGVIPGKDFTKISAIPSATDTTHVTEASDDYAGGDGFRFSQSAQGGDDSAAFEAQVAVERHSRSANYLFLDGHIGVLRWRMVQQMLTRPESRFLNPDGHQPLAE